jgi:hypothetical protein
MSDVTRRAFVGTISAVALSVARASDDWIELFNGRNLDGWRANGNADSWKVSEGLLVGDGPTSHLFYNGPVRDAMFRNFDLIAELKTTVECNSGVYFHTAWQESGFPNKGFEVQVDNTYIGTPHWLERGKTASLYGLRNIYKQLVDDDRWFEMQISVRGKNVQIRLNGTLVVDYVEPTPPVIPDGPEKERFLDKGTFALQCHNPGPKVYFRSVRVRPLPDNLTADVPSPVADDVFKKIVNDGRRNIPMVDFHVHLKEGLTLEAALAQSRRDGIFYGIAINGGKGFPIESDEGIQKFYDSMKGQPCFIAMQAEGREWRQMFSRRVAALFDYVFTDSMTWSDDNGKRMRLWIPEEVGTIADPQAFMDMLVRRAVGILEQEPIDIYVNPTFLPDSIAKDYDRLWTEERMEKVIRAAAKNQIAIEMNDRYKIPSAAFIRRAKEAGCKFTFGTNNTSPKDLGRSEYGLRMIDECKLEWQDFFVPQAWWPKAVERKGDALRG